MRRHWKASAAFISAVSVGIVTPLVYDAIKSTTTAVVEGDRDPFTWTTQVNAPEDIACQPYVFDSTTKVSFPDPVTHAHAWAQPLHGVSGDTVTLRLTLQGRSADSVVVLHDLRVTVESRGTPKGVAYYLVGGCGGQSVRAFGVSLDDPKLKVASNPGTDGPAVKFPYKISSTDPEVFLIDVKTHGCDCKFHLDLDWTSGEHSKTTQIRDGRTAFHVTGTDGLPLRRIDMRTNQWGPIESY